eukprot:7379870-Prymnesium_polylepis.1
MCVTTRWGDFGGVNDGIEKKSRQLSCRAPRGETLTPTPTLTPTLTLTPTPTLTPTLILTPTPTLTLTLTFTPNPTLTLTLTFHSNSNPHPNP